MLPSATPSPYPQPAPARMTEHKLTPLIAAEIRGIDLSAAMDDETFAAIEHAWHDHGVLLFRHQQLDDMQQVKFAERFGELAHTLKHFEGAAHPAIMYITNEKKDLTGAIGYGLVALGSIETRGSTWSFGPAISLPIFDAGRRAANVDAAKARYAEALARYQSRATRAVREVEESLVRIFSAGNRDSDAKAALRGYDAFLTAADAKVRAGSGSLIELEEARRAVVAAQFAVVNIERERLNAWITLYRAVGGAWQEAPAAIANAATDKDKP